MRPLLVFGLLAVVACRKTDPDPDHDGVNTADGDCQPFDAAIAPEMPEACNGLDDDCSGVADDAPVDGTLFFADVDGDGYGDADASVSACAQAPGTSVNDLDCDDADPSAHPGATEDCEEPVDRNCDGSSGFEDGDGDGFAACQDCDDAHGKVNPDADELCNDLDDDCNEQVDDAPTNGDTYFLDLDGDGAGSDAYELIACAPPDGYASVGEDCDDLDATAAPTGTEVCDGIDNDCDGTPDDGVGGQIAFYIDGDSDGFGDAGTEVRACTQPVGYVRDFEDCDDAQGDVHPGAAEANCSDPVDYNCDGSVGSDDADGDTFTACVDCDDTAATVHTGAVETCNDVDDDCDGEIDEVAPTWYADIDGDGFGGTRLTVVACDAPTGFVATQTDCDDLLATVRPGAVEACDGVDTDCSGGVTGETDTDGDGYFACKDCNDTDLDVHPGAPEWCNAADDDCDTKVDESAFDAARWYKDADSDGHGVASSSVVACSPPVGYVASDDDCDDTSAAKSPDTVWYLDADGDGTGGVIAVKSCTGGTGYVVTTGDCDDLNAKTEPGNAEVCDGRDNDCTGGVPANETDADRDGFLACVDCNDADNTVSPGAPERCNTRDDDCDTVVDDNPLDARKQYLDDDADGYGDATKSMTGCPTAKYVENALDCDDANPAISPIDPELCNNIDDDCDVTKDESAVDALTFYKDVDLDGYGLSTSTVVACAVPAGYTTAAGDCNDESGLVSPGADELCNAIDDDCDGTKDEGAIDAPFWYRDVDVDGYGAGSASVACAQPSGYVATNTDCNDGDKNSSPAGSDVPFDTIDQDCKGGDFQPSTCLALHTAFPALGSATYSIDVDGPGGSVPVTTYCDMTTDGGGWTLASYAFNGTTSCAPGTNVAHHSLKAGGGVWAPTNRNNTSAAIASVVLARASTSMAISMQTSGSQVATGGLGAYQYAWKIGIPNPSKVTFVNHSYSGGFSGPADNQSGPCVAVTVTGIVGDVGIYSRYTLQNSLGTQWTDTYPQGYGAMGTSSCYNGDGGPMVTSIHTGDRSTAVGCGPSVMEADLTYHGDVGYTHRGSYTPTTVNNTGSTAIWFK